jgi:hypothetical protein
LVKQLDNLLKEAKLRSPQDVIVEENNWDPAQSLATLQGKGANSSSSGVSKKPIQGTSLADSEAASPAHGAVLRIVLENAVNGPPLGHPLREVEVTLHVKEVVGSQEPNAKVACNSCICLGAASVTMDDNKKGIYEGGTTLPGSLLDCAAKEPLQDICSGQPARQSEALLNAIEDGFYDSSKRDSGLEHSVHLDRSFKLCPKIRKCIESPNQMYADHTNFFPTTCAWGHADLGLYKKTHGIAEEDLERTTLGIAEEDLDSLTLLGIVEKESLPACTFQDYSLISISNQQQKGPRDKPPDPAYESRCKVASHKAGDPKSEQKAEQSKGFVNGSAPLAPISLNVINSGPTANTTVVKKLVEKPKGQLKDQGWRTTRLQAKPSHMDPHDNFLDTPRERALTHIAAEQAGCQEGGCAANFVPRGQGGPDPVAKKLDGSIYVEARVGAEKAIAATGGQSPFAIAGPIAKETNNAGHNTNCLKKRPLHFCLRLLLPNSMS